MTGAPRRATEAVTRAEEPAATHHPSLLHYSPALVLLAIVIADAFRAADPDLWGRIRFGQIILSSGHAARVDPFNYSAPGRVWLHYVWMSDVVFAWLYAHLGVVGLKLLKFSCTGAVIIFIVLAVAETAAERIVQLSALLLTTIPLNLGMQFRPQVFDYVCVSAIVWLLSRDNYRRSAPFLLTIPMFALWSNLHPGYFIGLAAMAVYGLASAARDVRADRGIRWSVRFCAILAFDAVATLVNPFAIASWKAIFISFRDPYISHVMADWRPLLTRLTTTPFPSLVNLYSAYALALIVALAILFAIFPAAGDLPLVAVAALMSAAAFAAERNISLAMIAIAPPLALRVDIFARRWRPRTAPPAASTARRPPAHEAIVVGVAALLAWNTGLFSPKLRDAIWPPSGAVAFMEAHDLHGNILNEFTWGEYLIWHVGPRSRIFIDGRFDLVYPLSVIRDYTNFMFAAPEAARVLASYPHDFVLIEPDAEASRLMATRADWKLIYEDPHCVLFARSDSAAAKIAGIPVHGEAGGDEFP